MIKLKDLLIELGTHNVQHNISGKKLSNAINNIRPAGLKLGKLLSPNLTKKEFEIIIADELKHAKTEHGFDPHGPNVNEFRIAVAQQLWHQPVHPSSIPIEWRSLPWKIKERLFVYSDSPVQVSGYQLNKKEATYWLTSISQNRKYGGNDWETWMREPLLWITRYIKLGNYIPRSKLIADWIVYQDKIDKGIFSKPRTQHMPDGREVEYKYSDIIDEIQHEDLVAGIKTNVGRAFQRANARTTEAYIIKLEKMHIKFQDIPWKLLPGMEYLDTPQKLVDEGKEMSHCVAGYAPLAIDGKIFIISIKTSEGRSTLEVSKKRDIRQHRGRCNSEPPEENKRLVNRWKYLANIK